MIRLFEIGSGQSKAIASFKDKLLDKMVWLPDGKGLLALYQDASTHYTRYQIGLISYPGGQFHAVTKDTNDYRIVDAVSRCKDPGNRPTKNSEKLLRVSRDGHRRKPSESSAPQGKGYLRFRLGGDGRLLSGGAGQFRTGVPRRKQ